MDGIVNDSSCHPRAGGDPSLKLYRCQSKDGSSPARGRQNKALDSPGVILTIGDISVEIIRKAIKNMYLRIHASTGAVTVTAPLKLSLKTIQNHLQSKLTWIIAAREKAVARKPATPTLIKMESGEKHLFLGKEYTLSMHTNAPSQRIAIQDNILFFYLKTNARNEPLLYLQTWYKQQMLALLPGLIQKWEPIIGVRVHAFGVKAMKTRWGSCNVVAHRIWLNLKLIQKPLICLEYVLVHEMVHLLEANHSKQFYALMTQFLPQWKAHQKLLEGSVDKAECS